MAAPSENASDCSVSYDVIEDLAGQNITEEVVAIWPCELRSFWEEILPFVDLVRFLLSYGTSLIVLVGVMGNILSFIVLTQRQMRSNAQNVYLSVLAIYDTCTLVFNFMVGIMRGSSSQDINRTFQESEALCTLHGVVVELFNILSVWILVAFTVERFIMFKFPLKYKPSLKNTYITVTVVSVLVALISLHKIAVSGFEGDSVYGYKACKTRRKIFKEIIYLYVALNTWLPTTLITCVNLVIIHEMRLNRRRRDQLTQSIMSGADDKTTRLLLLVSTRYVLLVLPLGVVQTTELIWNGSMAVLTGNAGYVDFMVTKIRLKWTRAFFFFFYQFNFAINFFLYLKSSSAKQFRFYLRQVLGMKQGQSLTFITELHLC
ncbi:FMRFamide peptide receptor frpr-18-like [Mercenaria mercenaria]|uniref:FMRFamide peptide receptor frpr-18-like n=1 Tax=Mercenaria mercenaria TaxID=6596 RepID=UPI00234F3047|nr:FMRFamide peptide receptor frpr-18-like [Mercenaria mercenaria]